MTSPPTILTSITANEIVSVIANDWHRTDVLVGGFNATVSNTVFRHVIAYSVLSATIMYALVDVDRSRYWKALLVFALAMGYGMLMEFGQLFQPDRFASLADVVANAVGIAIALSWYGFELQVEFVPVRTFEHST
ncbi:VanZ family protein [Natrialbaceae archaeon A-arb3/5]